MKDNKFGLEDLVIGDILLVRGQNWVSRAIHRFTDSQYSHACCYIGNELLVESAVGGVQINHLSKYPEYTVVRHIDPDKKLLQRAVDIMIMNVGKKYDYSGLIGIALKILFNKKRNWFDRKDRYWCSELVADAYLQSGLVLDVCENTYDTSPADLKRDMFTNIIYKDWKFERKECYTH